ncbi:MAG TPA: tRNA (guanosine(37)-N1)-methyltransferase TrmD [Acholeplasmataceae bacterium]|nr:MAG: tRNA (guanosine(37)-N1)-methyltransferase TrmD [Tenericutes bacterium GWA2_38_26]OHE31157.1 MAG: tRNA (guanosine(37)-N1)-methyltransferase TrmD [Tenericutes bacterium GWC2_39_45]OHE32585.1 MAG: tRNA (guanosine(37)-N1)-methyltransferase TrmD [Tenericutes bacterium GWD2_38_27]OHE39936.1 MAG: tRNA (guanosine(37)-N1)-methyltransferase TrmD [Tenericutes bacterium GWE2_38_8]OHE45352.1 MAG: tRNA (guanosine(37)-N1)-methyltransferase TrmD [Tenericutes bacterium GWF2_38_8]HBG32682.1 tRNA (guanos
MIIDIVTIFPEFFDTFLGTSIIKRAIESKFVEINLHQLRDYSHNKHKKIDDTPYGGGVGMLMQFPPFYDVIDKLKGEQTKVILLSPQGKLFNQETAKSLAQSNHLILLCGHYEGIDARVESLIDMELSIGDYVLTGGEIPAMIVADTVSRLLPGVIHEDSSLEDSLQNGLLKYPQYTKPDHYKGFDVPEVLLSGNHQNIEKWRNEEQIKQTFIKRPDLIEKVKLSKDQEKVLKKIKEHSK